MATPQKNGIRGQPYSNRRPSSNTTIESDRRPPSVSVGRIPRPQGSNGETGRVAAVAQPKGEGGERRSSAASTPPSKSPNGIATRPSGRERQISSNVRRRSVSSGNEFAAPSSSFAQPQSSLGKQSSTAPRPLPTATRPSPDSRSRPARATEVMTSRAASGKDLDRNAKTPAVFDVFFDLPHPAASKDSEPARMIEPPEVYNQAILSELYEPTSISRLARFAFPEHDDHKHAINVRTQPVGQRTDMSKGKGIGGRDRGEHLNRLDIYVLGYRSERHTFTLLLSDGVTKLFGHVLRYLPTHSCAKARADVGRRGVRAMILLTRAAGGDQFYTAILKSIEAVILQGDAFAKAGNMDDGGRFNALRMLHGVHRRLAAKLAETTFLLSRAGRDDPPVNPDELEDTSLTLPAVEYDIKAGGFIPDRTLPGDFLTFHVPQSLQAAFQVSSCPDDIDAPVLPLLRSLGAENTMRLISAMLCEQKIILVSAHVQHLSTCVRGASSLLAQGHLVWQHNQVPVLPPHMLSCLLVKRPYLVGLLDDYVENLESLRTLTDVLCIHLDKNLIRTFGMANAAKLIPDIMSKDSQKSGSGVLFNDMEQILKAEKRIWGEFEAKPIEKEEKAVSAVPPDAKVVKKKKGKAELGKIETDIAYLFGKVMRGDVLGDDDDFTVESSIFDEGNEHSRVDKTSGHLPRAIEHVDRERDTLTTFDVCENERGEEGLRAALTFFFLVTHGDLGTMLTEHNGTYLLDRKKYLLTKKKAGNKEESPMFALYRQFSGTAMLEHHLGQRIEEFERGGKPVMPRHRSLFSLCERHLRNKKVEFTFPNIRMLISKTTVHAPLHALVERSEIARARALTLTAAQPFDGNIALALSSLMKDCHQCDRVLPQIMAVVWSRLDDRRSSGWKHPLLGLHLLKNLLLHGPITTLSFAMDGADKVRKLRFYSVSKNAENNKEVRESSQFVWNLMIDRPRLFLRRQQVVSGRAKLNEIPQGARWGNYLIKKVPFNTDFREYHTLMRPHANFTPCFMKQSKIGMVGYQDVRQVDSLRMTVQSHEGGEKPTVTLRGLEVYPGDPAGPRPTLAQKPGISNNENLERLSQEPNPSRRAVDQRRPDPRQSERRSIAESKVSQRAKSPIPPMVRERNSLNTSRPVRNHSGNGEFRSPPASKSPQERRQR